jgi:hypothetical protein
MVSGVKIGMRVKAFAVKAFAVKALGVNKASHRFGKTAHSKQLVGIIIKQKGQGVS